MTAIHHDTFLGQEHLDQRREVQKNFLTAALYTIATLLMSQCLATQTQWAEEELATRDQVF